MHKPLFLCDHDKNIFCGKQSCYVNGGMCELTSNIKYAKELTPVNKLEIMLDTQRAFQERLGADFKSMTVRDRVAFIKEHSIHLNQEINEMLYELPYFKPWKDYTGITTVDEAKALCKAQMELIDAWHFFMNLALGLGMTADTFYEMYMAKNKENHRRQDAGYTADVSYKDQDPAEVLFDEQD